MSLRSVLHFGLAVALLCAATGPLGAQSLQSLRAQEAEEQALASEAAFTGTVCGAPIAASIDWPSFEAWSEPTGMTAACGGALGAVEALCREGRNPRIDRFVCAGDGSGPVLSGGGLRYGARAGADAYALTRAALENR